MNKKYFGFLSSSKVFKCSAGAGLGRIEGKLNLIAEPLKLPMSLTIKKMIIPLNSQIIVPMRISQVLLEIEKLPSPAPSQKFLF